MSNEDVQTDAAPLDEDAVDALETTDEKYFDHVDASDVAEAEAYEPKHFSPEETPPRPAQPNRGAHKSSTQISKEVLAGKWGEDGWEERVEAAGFDTEMVKLLVARGVGRV